MDRYVIAALLVFLDLLAMLLDLLLQTSGTAVIPFTLGGSNNI